MEAEQSCSCETGASDAACSPFAVIPAWWGGFLFHVLNPRQICMYAYLTMLADRDGRCHPTIDNIREDLGLYSSSMVFEALTVLEDLGFIVRERHAFPGVRAKRNVYRKPSCEATVLRLLERGRLDGYLQPVGPSASPASAQAKELVVEGLQRLLGDAYDRYERATPAAKRDVLLEILEQLVSPPPDLTLSVSV